MSDCQTKYYFSWKIVAQIIGWIGIVTSFASLVLYGPVTLIFDSLAYILAFMVVCGVCILNKSSLIQKIEISSVFIGLNLITCICWLMGVLKVSNANATLFAHVLKSFS